MNKTSFWKKLIYGYDKLEEYLLCGSLVFTTLVIFAQILMRTLFNRSLTWSEELTRYVFIWQIWMGVSIAQRDNTHIKVELLFAFVKSKKARAVVDLLASLVWLAFTVFLLVNSSQLVGQMFARGNVSSAMRLPMYLVYFVLPLSSFVLLLRLMGQLVRDCGTLLFPDKEAA